jgi:hypothetical protein
LTERHLKRKMDKTLFYTKLLADIIKDTSKVIEWIIDKACK